MSGSTNASLMSGPSAAPPAAVPTLEYLVVGGGGAGGGPKRNTGGTAGTVRSEDRSVGRESG